MSEELFHELVAQFAEALPEKDSRDFSGTVGAIQLRNELKKQKQCGVSTRSSLKCKVLTDEIKEAARLEVKILELMSLIIKDRRVNGDEITFEKRDGAFGRSMIYAEIKKLYAIRYGKEETLRLDEAFNGLGENTGARLVIEYERHVKNPRIIDMSPENFFIKRIYFRYTPIPE